MKTPKLMLNAMLIAALCIGTLTAQDKAGPLTTTTEITVKPGHHAQFKEGVKKWKECYLENNGERKWSFWHRVQGEGNVYVMLGTKDNWAAMDADDPVNKACYATLLSFISPHVEKVNYNISQVMTDVSRTWPDDGKHAWVTYYNVKRRDTFKEVITEVSGAIKDKEGSSRGLWREYKGGPADGPDFMVASPYASFADMDIERDTPAKIYKDAAGEEKSNEMRDKWMDTVLDSWSYIYTLNTELSN